MKRMSKKYYTEHNSIKIVLKDQQEWQKTKNNLSCQQTDRR